MVTEAKKTVKTADVEDDEPPSGGEKKPTKFTSKKLMDIEEIKAMGMDESKAIQFQRHKYREATALDQWIGSGPLASHTFRTESLKLNMEECQMLLDACDYYRKTSSGLDMPENFSIDEEIKEKLSEKIRTLVNEKFPEGFFVKLNTRSPKDSPNYDYCDHYKALFRHELGRVDLKDPNQGLLSYVRFQAKANLCQSVDDFFRLFGGSFRVVEDLRRAMSFGDEHLNVSLEFREFHQELPDHPEAEFRCFVNKKKMTAVTQYFEPLYFPELHHNKEKYGERILEYFDTIKDHIPLEEYVLDVAVLPNEIFVIELNPFYTQAGSGFFSWKDDRELLLNGPFEIRVREEPQDDPLKFLSKTWRKFVDDYIKEHEEETYCCVML